MINQFLINIQAAILDLGPALLWAVWPVLQTIMYLNRRDRERSTD